MFSNKKNGFKSQDQRVQEINKKYNVNKKIGLFAFFALTASMVMTIYEYASFASAGWALIVFLFIGGLCWFIPVAIMSAEMATVKGWTDGGLFTWVQRTLGTRWGFSAIFFQWFQITIGFVTMLLFITTMLSFSFGGTNGLKVVTGIEIATEANPVLGLQFGDAQSTLTWATVGITFAIVVLIFIVITLSQLFGVRYTSLISRIGFMSGIVFPFFLLFIFGIIFISRKGLNGSMGTFLPTQENADNAMAIISELVIFVSFILSFLGVEASASQINNLKKPEKNYPRVMVILVSIQIIFSSIAGVFIAIATRVGSSDSSKLSYTGGIIQAFLIMTREIMGNEAAAMGTTRFISFLMGFAVIAQISSWIVGPSKAMQVAAKNGLLPSIFAKLNRFGVPIYMISLQSVFVIIWSVVIVFGMMGGLGINGSGDNGSNAGFLAAMQLTVLTYLLAYFLLMITYLKFSLSKSYAAEAGVILLKHKWMKVFVASLALLTNLFSFIVALFPQSNDSSTYGTYYGIIFGLFIPTVCLPFLIYWVMNKKHKISSDGVGNSLSSNNMDSNNLNLNTNTKMNAPITNSFVEHPINNNSNSNDINNVNEHFDGQNNLNITKKSTNYKSLNIAKAVNVANTTNSVIKSQKID